MRKVKKHNSKATKIKCLRCENEFSAHRNDAKFCSDLCRVQERLGRKEKGYIISLVAGNKIELEKEFKVQEPKSLFNIFPIDNDISKLRNEVSKNEDLKLSWKFETKEYLLYCFPHLKKKPFELFCTKEQNNQYVVFAKPVMIRPKIVVKKVQ